jgi:hypothetical protein
MGSWAGRGAGSEEELPQVRAFGRKGEGSGYLKGGGT